MKLSLAILSSNPDPFSNKAWNGLPYVKSVATVGQMLFKSACWHAVYYADESVDVVGLGNGIELEPWSQNDLASLALDLHARKVLKLPVQNNTYRLESLPKNIGVPAGFHRLYETARNNDPHDHLIAYIHDDLRILERGWDVRVKKVFADPSVVLVGFAGAEGLGARELYSTPFHVSLISRDGPLLSNLLLHAEWHGRRTTQEQEIAFLDGFSLILRQSFLDQIGGWSWWKGREHHAYDAGMACMVRRHGQRAWLVPVQCDHGIPDIITHARHAGSANAYYDLATQHGGHEKLHENSSRFVYEEFADVLPFKIGDPLIASPPTRVTPAMQFEQAQVAEAEANVPPVLSKREQRKASQAATYRAAFKKKYRK